MCWTTPSDDAVRTFFRAHYVLWLIGELEPEVEQELDALSDPNCENWKQVLRRELACSPDDLRQQFHVLCETHSIEEAIARLLDKFGFVALQEASQEPLHAPTTSRPERFDRGRRRLWHRPPC